MLFGAAAIPWEDTLQAAAHPASSEATSGGTDSELERSRAHADLLYVLAAAVIRAERVEQVYDACLEAIGRAVETDRASVLVFDGEGVMRFAASKGLSED